MEITNEQMQNYIMELNTKPKEKLWFSYYEFFRKNSKEYFKSELKEYLEVMVSINQELIDKQTIECLIN